MCVASAIDDDYTELHLSKGEHTLQGVDALKFLRTRHGVGDGSDLTRISSQQVFLSSLVRKLKAGSTLTDFTKLYAIATAASNSMSLSKSLADPTVMVQMARAFQPIDLNKVVFVQYPTAIQGGGVVPSIEAAAKLIKAVKKDKSIKLAKPTTGETSGAGAQDDGSSDEKGATASAYASPSASATAKSSDKSVEIDASGTTAATETCSVGNTIGRR